MYIQYSFRKVLVKLKISLIIIPCKKIVEKTEQRRTKEPKLTIFIISAWDFNK